MKIKFIQGLIILFLASFCWGIGNFFTGFTAGKYTFNSPVKASIDISIANTFGGLVILTLILLFKSVFSTKERIDDLRKNEGFWYKNRTLFLSGFFKGLNTFLFVLSTTYIPASHSLIYESTYIFWTLIFVSITSPFILSGKIVFGTILLFVGIYFVEGGVLIKRNSFKVEGVSLGLLAGFSYSLFFYKWSILTEININFQNLVKQVMKMLLISLFTLIALANSYTLVYFKKVWLPFQGITMNDFYLQTLNGFFVIGATYILVSIGMNLLSKSTHIGSFLAILILSFSIIITFCFEIIFNNVAAKGNNILGIGLFLLGFILIRHCISGINKNIK